MNELQPVPDESADIMRYSRILLRRSWIVLLVAVLAVIVVMAVELTASPKYQASATIAFNKSGLDIVLFGNQFFSDSDPDKAVEAAAAGVKLKSFGEEVKARLKIDMPVSQLLAEVSAKAATDTDTATIQVTDPNPQRAAQIANAVAAQYIADREALEHAKARTAADTVKRELDSLAASDSSSEFASELRGKYQALLLIENEQVSGFTVSSSAETPADSTSQPVRTGVLAFIVGLVLGVVFVLFLDYLASFRVEKAELPDKES